MVTCPKCNNEVIPYGGDRLKSIFSGILYYVTWCECDKCDYSFQTVKKINK
jgi:hypothetical protein